MRDRNNLKQRRRSLNLILAGLLVLLGCYSAHAEDFKSLKEKGKFFIEKKWYEDAQKDLHNAVKDYPEEAAQDDEVHFLLALLYYNQSSVGEAVEELNLALKLKTQEKYVELMRTITAEFGALSINTAEKIEQVKIRIKTSERFISPRKKLVFNRWKNRFLNENFDLPLQNIYLPIGQYDMTFELPLIKQPMVKEVNIDADGKQNKLYLLLIHPPQNIIAEGRDDEIYLSWAQPGPGTVAGYLVYRKVADSDEEYTKIAETAKLNYTDKDLGIGKSYSYRLKAYDPQVEKTDFSEQVLATTLSLLPPTEVVALGEDRQVNLFWVTAAGAQVSSYRIYRSSSTEKDFKLIAEVNDQTSYVDYDLERGMTYIYKLKAYNSAGSSSPYSEKATAKTMAISAPQKVKIMAESGGIELLWKKVSGASAYNIYRGGKKLGKYELIAQVSGREIQYVDLMESPEAGVDFWYKVTTLDKDEKETQPSVPISLSQPQVSDDEEQETLTGTDEWLEDGLNTAPAEQLNYKIYFSKAPDEEFVETKGKDLFSLVSGLKPRQKLYYKIVSLDSRGNPEASISFALLVDKINQPPVAVTSGDRQVLANQSFILDGAGSTDPENDKLVYKWVQRLDNPNEPSSLLLSLDPKVEVSFDVPGEYVFYLEVSDGELNSIQTVIIEVIAD